MLPAVVLGIVQIVVPAGRTVWTSLFQTRPFGGGAERGRFLGLEAYAEAELVEPLLLGLVVGLPAFFVAGLAGVAIGSMATVASEGLRLAVRGVLGVLVVLYAPIGIGLALRFGGDRDLGFGFLVYVLGLVVLPVGTALAALVTMAAAGPDGVTPTGRRGATVALVVGVGLVAAVALGLQFFGLPATVTNVSQDGALPGTLIYLRGFQLFDLSAAAAVSTVLLVLLALLGVVVTVLLLTARVRVELAPRTPPGAPGPTGNSGLGAVALLLTVVVLVGFLVLAREWVAGLFAPLPSALSFDEAVRAAVNSWIPSLAATLIQVVVGALAGVGVGWLRPAGRGSEWLLLLFAPGLFVTLTPLLIAKFVGAIDRGSFGESWVPPLLVSIPAIYVCTFLAAGLRRAWEADRLGRARAVLSGLAAVTLVFVVLWVVQAQTVTWNLVSATDPDRFGGPLTLARLASTFTGESLPQQLATPIPLLAVLAAVAAAAITGMDRLRVRVGRDPVVTNSAGPAMQKA